MLESPFNKVAGKACNFIKKGLQQRFFRVNIMKFLRTSFFTEHLRWLPLNLHKKFRRGPGRLLNVFSPFSLRPVFRGMG